MKKIIFIILVIFCIYMYYDFILFDWLNVLQVDNGDDFDDFEFDFKNKIRSILYVQPDPPILVPGPVQGAWVPLGPPQNPVGGPNDLVIAAACVCVIAVGVVVVNYSIKYIRILFK